MPEKKIDSYMPLWIGDYLADTGRLSTVQHGAYMLIIMDYWRNGPPPDDDETLSRIARMNQPEWKKYGATIRSFFVVMDGKLTHKRIDSELSKAKLNRATANERALKGAYARWHSGTGQAHDPDASSTAQAQHKHETSSAREVLDQCASPLPLPKEEENPPNPPKIRGDRFNPLLIDFPPELQTSEFRDSWTEWIAYRREKKSSCTPKTITKQIQSLASVGSANAILCLQESIRNGWTGIFPKKNSDSVKVRPETQAEYAQRTLETILGDHREQQPQPRIVDTQPAQLGPNPGPDEQPAFDAAR